MKGIGTEKVYKVYKRGLKSRLLASQNKSPINRF